MMISNKWRFMKHTAKLYDMCALVAAFLFATFVLLSSPRGMSVPEFMALRIKLGNCLLFALLLIAWHNLFILCGLYVSKRLTKRSTEVYGVIKATSLASLFLLFMARVIHIQMVSAPFVLILWIACIGAVGLDLHPPAAAVPLLAAPKLMIDSVNGNGNPGREPGERGHKALAVGLARGLESKHAKDFMLAGEGGKA